MKELCDYHIHTGTFRDEYYSPQMIVDDLNELGVDKWVFSSLSTGHLEWSAVRDEIDETIERSGGRAIPFLWVVQDMLDDDPTLDKYFYRDFAGIKAHGRFEGWQPDGPQLDRVFHIAGERGLPIKLHTGGDSHCDAGAYRTICSKYPEQTVIMAHGRPVDETIAVMRECPNVYADTAFMPTEDIRTIIECGEKIYDRLLFGTDYPLTSYFYKDIPKLEYYHAHVDEIKRTVGEQIFAGMSNTDIFRK